VGSTPPASDSVGAPLSDGYKGLSDRQGRDEEDERGHFGEIREYFACGWVHDSVYTPGVRIGQICGS
jgi:hypothetical protein